jgi:putative transposase
MDDETKRRIALWRFGVLGPLVSARLEHGDRAAWFREAAERVHQLPDGRVVKLSPRTIEAWYQGYRHGGFDALLPQTRSDHRQSRSIPADVADLIVRAKSEKPRRSIRRIIRLLERAGVVPRGELSRSSVHRLLQVHGVSARPVRGATERRSFLHEHAGDLWVGDAMHGPLVLGPDGRPHKSYMLSVIDGATRFVPHSCFTLSESAVEQERAFKQALLKHGLPRVYYVDRGPAYIAHSLQLICAELSVRHLNTEKQDPEAKGVIERWHETVRAEVEDELPSEPLPLAELNALHWAWLSVEYLGREHDTTKRVPREHWLSHAHELRALPRGKNLDEVFLHRAKRIVRKDGTVRFGGVFLEVRPELQGREVELRFDPSDPDARPRVFLDDHFYCDTVPLDRHANAARKRHRGRGAPAPTVIPTGLDPLALIQREHDEHARPAGLAALAALAHDDDDDTDTEE